MKEIEFDNNNISREIETTRFPSILFNFLHFQTTDPNWALRLVASSIQITLKCFDNNGRFLGQIMQFINPQINPNQIQPYIIFNNLPLRFDLQATFINKTAIVKYKIDIDLTGIQLNDDEKYHIAFHLLQHSSYQIFCDGVTIGTVFITDGHPTSSDKRNVTLIPVTVQTHGSAKSLIFNKHENLFADITDTDEQIIENLFTSNKLVCMGNRSIVVL